MSGQTIKNLGAVGKKDAPEIPPESLTIVGIDISQEALKALYPGNGGLHAVIDALVDVRNDKPVTPEFVACLRGGAKTPILIRDLGPDVNGKRWICVNEGRKRTLALRLVNEERKQQGFPAYNLLAIAQTYSLTAEGASTARLIKAIANTHEESSPIERARLAEELRSTGVSMEQTAVMLKVKSEQAVKDILSLLECSPAVQEAVDAGTVSQTVARKLAKLDPAKQDEKLAKLTGKKGKAAAAVVEAPDGAEPKATPRMQRKPHLEAVRDELASLDKSEWLSLEDELPHVESVIRYVLGDSGALNKTPGFFRLAVEKAIAKAAA